MLQIITWTRQAVLIHKGLVLAPTAWFAAAAGTTSPGARGRRSGVGVRRTAAATTWGSGLSCLQVSEPSQVGSGA